MFHRINSVEKDTLCFYFHVTLNCCTSEFRYAKYSEKLFRECHMINKICASHAINSQDIYVYHTVSGCLNACVGMVRDAYCSIGALANKIQYMLSAL